MAQLLGTLASALPGVLLSSHSNRPISIPSRLPPSSSAASPSFPGVYTDSGGIPSSPPVEQLPCHQPIHIPQCQLPVPRNTFYPGTPASTPGKLRHFLPGNPQPPHSPKNQRRQQKQGKNSTHPTKSSADISTQSYSHSKPRCLDTRIKTQQQPGQGFPLLEPRNPTTLGPE